MGDNIWYALIKIHFSTGRCPSDRRDRVTSIYTCKFSV